MTPVSLNAVIVWRHLTLPHQKLVYHSTISRWSQGNRIWKLVDSRIIACPIWDKSILPVGVGNAAREAALDRFIACWEGLEDPRTGNAALYDFPELLIMALCAVLSGGQGAVDMAEFAKAKEAFLRGFLKLVNGFCQRSRHQI